MRIVIVADLNSIHVSKFIETISTNQHELILFNSSLYLTLENTKWPNRIYVDHHKGESFNLQIKALHSKNLTRKIYLRILRTFHLFDPVKLRKKALLNLIIQEKPNLLISLSTQNSGYLAFQAFTELVDQEVPKWIHFIWGTDLELYWKNKSLSDKHKKRILQVIDKCDLLWTDTERDKTFIEKLGYSTKCDSKMIAFGGFKSRDLEYYRQNNNSNRKKIIIKARTDKYVGRLKVILSALEMIVEDLKTFEIHFIMISTKDKKRIIRNYRLQELNKVFHDRMPYSQLLHLMSESLLGISATTVDGTPGFLAECMATGAVPVHSRMISIEEWITSNANGYLFDINDSTTLARIISNLIYDEKSVARIQRINYEIAYERFNMETNGKKFLNIINNLHENL